MIKRILAGLPVLALTLLVVSCSNSSNKNQKVAKEEVKIEIKV